MYQSIELHVTRHSTHIRHDTQYLVFLTFSSRAMSEVLDDPVMEENGVAQSQSQEPSVPVPVSTQNSQVKCSQEDPSDSEPVKDDDQVQVKLEIPDYEPGGGGGGIGEEIDPVGGTAQAGDSMDILDFGRIFGAIRQ